MSPHQASGPIDPVDLPADSSARVGLLAHLTAHAMDEDYAVVAQQKGSGRRTPVLTLLAVAAFVMLLVTSALQTNQQADTDATDRNRLVNEVQKRREEVDADQARIDKLQAQVNLQRRRLASNAQLDQGTRTQLAVYGASAGSLAVRGPGIIVTVDDNPKAASDQETVLDIDLQRLVNALWASGAEAIAINGQRLTNLTAIRQAGQAITVGYRSLERPYRISVIGDAGAMPGRLADTRGGATWLDLKQQFGLRFEVVASDEITLPAARATTLRHVEEQQR